jgi:hypothetical protein
MGGRRGVTALVGLLHGMGWSAILPFSYGRAPGGLDIAVFTRRPDPILQSANDYHYP